MRSIQYTIRGIPQEVDQKIREEARASGKSLNTIVLETLSHAKGRSGPPYYDLDWFFTSQREEEAAEKEALDWLDTLPRDLEE